jgi:glycosyltransferase involved in cell wall biosynthesis
MNSKEKTPVVVSVIIPTYNRAQVVSQPIQSVLAQTFRDFEVIVVDDGSNDNTESVVKAFCDPRVRYIRHEKNRGGSAARNTGIKAARGAYIAFLDSDDEWLPEKLQSQLDILQELPPSWGGVCTGFWLIEGTSVVERIPKLPPNLSNWLLAHCPLSAGSTLMVRKEILDEIGYFDESLPRHQDWDLLLRLVENYQLAMVKAALVRRYVGDQPPADKVREAKEKLLSKYKSRINGLSLLKRRQVVASHCLGLANLYFGERRFRRGGKFLIKGALRNPLQRPGLYLGLVDAILGTHLASRLSALKWGILGRVKRSARARKGS